jgi:hypothetical protein
MRCWILDQCDILRQVLTNFAILLDSLPLEICQPLASFIIFVQLIKLFLIDEISYFSVQYHICFTFCVSLVNKISIPVINSVFGSSINCMTGRNSIYLRLWNFPYLCKIKFKLLDSLTVFK